MYGELKLHFEPASRYLFKTYSTHYPHIIRYFEKTPKTIVCPHFFELNWAYGCNFECAYCYLQGTFRGNKEPRYVPLNSVLSTLQQFFDYNSEPSILNSGELTDSLVFPSVIEKIADKFEEQNKHKLLLLTKSANVDFLARNPRKQTIVSFSINAPSVWKKWENKTPPPEKRVKAAKKVSDAGYEVRIRIDPIFPIDNWREEYGKLIELLLSKLIPERITLGTPRGLQKTLLYCKGDKEWIKYFTESSGWGKKISTPLRKEIYLFVIDKLTMLGFKNPIALCKETESMWKELKKDPGAYPYWKG